jgi:tol-pal system protein YbgF
MNNFTLTAFLVAFACQPVSAGINTDKVIINHSKKIKSLFKKNRALKGQIEQLAQKQLESDKKIAELFNLMKHNKSVITVDKPKMHARELNKKAKKIYTNARSLLITDQYNQAVNLFKQYLDTYPNNNYASDAHYWLAKTYLAKGDYQQARKTFVAFQQNSPLHYKYANSLFELARVYVELKQTQNAQKMLKKMINKYPSHSVINQAKQLLNKISSKKSGNNKSNKLN